MMNSRAHMAAIHRSSQLVPSPIRMYILENGSRGLPHSPNLNLRCSYLCTGRHLSQLCQPSIIVSLPWTGYSQASHCSTLSRGGGAVGRNPPPLSLARRQIASPTFLSSSRRVSMPMQKLAAPCPILQLPSELCVTYLQPPLARKCCAVSHSRTAL